MMSRKHFFLNLKSFCFIIAAKEEKTAFKCGIFRVRQTYNNLSHGKSFIMSGLPGVI